MMRQTSLEAFHEIKLGLPSRREAVLSAIKHLVLVSDRQLSVFLQWPINCVTPRRNELVKNGVVVESGCRIENGRRVTVWCEVSRYGY